MEDLRVLTDSEALKDYEYTDTKGVIRTIAGRRFPLGKSVIIIAEAMRLAKDIGFADKWRIASERSERSRDQYRSDLADKVGPAPDYPDETMLNEDSPNYDPVKYKALLLEYNTWIVKFNSVSGPRSTIEILQDLLIPEIITLIDMAPDVVFKLIAYTISDWDSEIKPAKSSGNLNTFIEKKIDFAEDNLDMGSVGTIITAMVQLVGIQAFFKSLQSLLNQGVAEEETVTTTEPEETDEVTSRRSRKKTLSKE